MIIYLGVEEGSKDCDGSSKCVDGLDRCAEDDDGGDNDGYPLHGVSNAKCQGWDLVQGHVWNLIVQVIKHALCRHPPIVYDLEPQSQTIASLIDDKWENKRQNLKINRLE